MSYPFLVLIGVAVGSFGTLIGAGGGFILVPILLLLAPALPPDTVTAISLAVVCFNAASGSVAYLRKGRVDLRSGLYFALATLPGAVLGALATHALPRHTFDLVFGVVLVALSAYLLATARGVDRRQDTHSGGSFAREVVEADGTVHRYRYSLRTGLVISAVVGFVSSLLGIGGGIVHVPAMTYLLGFPVHVATATSHFTLALMALAGTLTHLAAGDLAGHYGTVAALGGGVVVGAQVGAHFSDRVRGPVIIRALAVALALVGVRILWGALA